MTQSPAAVLFADICGSTRLYESLGDRLALQYIDTYLEKLRLLSLRFGGSAIKTIGDAIMLTFPDAASALRAAVDMQLSTIGLPDAGGHKPSIHIGLHSGPVTLNRNDAFGDTVNVAAHLTSLAKSGQILTSSQVAENLPPHMRRGLRQIDTLTVKGKLKSTCVYEFIWRDDEDLTQIQNRPAAMQSSVLELEYGGIRYTLNHAKPVLSLGRSKESDLLITDRLASRQHARIEYRRDKAILVDTSTNGTYVTLEDKPEILVRREELALHASGTLCFGHSVESGTSTVARFFLQRNA